MACRCGATISDVLVPCPTKGWLLLRARDREALERAFCRDIDAFFEAVRGGRREQWLRERFTAAPDYPVDLPNEDVVKDIIDLHDVRALLSVAECEKCGRLWVQTAPGTAVYRSYTPDEGGHAGLLRSAAFAARAANEARWAVWRQDDNGHRALISAGHTRAEAERICSEFEERGHKQTYWVAPDAE